MKFRMYLLLLSILVLACLFAPVLAPCDPNLAEPTAKFAEISREHLLDRKSVV